MNDEFLSTQLRELLYAGEHRLLDDDLGHAVKRVLDAGVSDQFTSGVLRDRVHKHRVAQAFAGAFSIPHLINGELILGRDTRQNLVRCPMQYLNAHCLTVAGSGSGKTYRALFMALQIAALVRGMWLFDLRKREFCILQALLERLGIDLLVIPGRDLRLNPLQVPRHVEPMDWAPRVADMLVGVLSLPPRATKLLHTTILDLYRIRGVLNSSKDYPTLFELRESVSGNAQANVPAKQALLDSLDPVLMSLRPALCYRQGWTTEVLGNRKIVFELGGLAEADKDLILNTLLLGEFTSRIASGVSNQPMDLFVSCDEAARLVAPGRESIGIADLIGLVRGTGIGLDLAVQSGDILPAVLSNTATKFIGRCGSARDYDLIGAAMGLTAEQRRWMSLNLRPGLFVGQLGEGNWRHPFPFEVPFTDLQAHASTAGRGVRRGCGDLDQVPTVPATESGQWTAPSPAVPSAQIPGPADASSSSLSEAEIRFLRAVVEHPGEPSSVYAKLAGMSTKRAKAIRAQLVTAGMIREHQVQTNARGRSSIILEPLEPALRLVEAGQTSSGTGGGT